MEERAKLGERQGKDIEKKEGETKKKKHNGVWMSFVELILSLSWMFAFRIKRAPLE